MLFGTLGASLIGHMLAGQEINRAGEGIVRAGYGNKKFEKQPKKTKKYKIFKATLFFN